MCTPHQLQASSRIQNRDHNTATLQSHFLLCLLTIMGRGCTSPMVLETVLCSLYQPVTTRLLPEHTLVSCALSGSMAQMHLNCSPSSVHAVFIPELLGRDALLGQESQIRSCNRLYKAVNGGAVRLWPQASTESNSRAPQELSCSIY